MSDSLGDKKINLDDILDLDVLSMKPVSPLVDKSIKPDKDMLLFKWHAVSDDDLESLDEDDAKLILEFIHRSDGKFEIKVYESISMKMMEELEPALYKLCKFYGINDKQYVTEAKRFAYEYPYDIQNRLLIYFNPIMHSIANGICYPIIVNTDPLNKGDELLYDGYYIKTSSKLSCGQTILRMTDLAKK